MKLVEVRKTEGVKSLVNTGAVASVTWDEYGPVYAPNGSAIFMSSGQIMQGSFRTVFLGGATEYYLDNPLVEDDCWESRQPITTMGGAQ